MKKIIFCMMAVLWMSASQAQQFTSANLQATGLTCALCSNAINKSLLELPFVDTVKSEIKTSSFSISFKDNSQVSIDAIRKAVEDAGFSVGKLEITGQFQATEVEKDKHLQIGQNTYHFLESSIKNLSGEHTITLADKGFVSAKQFKKISSSHRMKCVTSGKAESCCTTSGVSAGARVYHVTI